MKNVILQIKTLAAFITLLALILSCKPQPSSEIQPLPQDSIKVLSFNRHQFTSGVAFGCPDGSAGATTSISYSIIVSPVDYEEYIFDSLWVACPPKSDTLKFNIEARSDTIIAYNFSNASFQSFNLRQEVDRNTYSLSVSYSLDPCRGFKVEEDFVNEKLPHKAPITPNTIGVGVISCYKKSYGSNTKRYIVLKNMTSRFTYGW